MILDQNRPVDLRANRLPVALVAAVALAFSVFASGLSAGVASSPADPAAPSAPADPGPPAAESRSMQAAAAGRAGVASARQRPVGRERGSAPTAGVEPVSAGELTCGPSNCEEFCQWHELECRANECAPRTQLTINRISASTDMAQRFAKRAVAIEEQQFLFYPGGRLKLELSQNESVKVAGWDQNSVRVVAEKVVRSDSEARAAEFLNGISIGSEPIPAGMAVFIRYPSLGTLARTQTVIRAGEELIVDDGSGYSVFIRLTIYAPFETNLELRGHNGDLSVVDLRGELALSTLNGKIELERVGGRVHARTVNGNVKVDLSGDLWPGTQVYSSTTNGSIEADIPLSYAGRVEARTVMGGIRAPESLAGNSKRLYAQLGQGNDLLALQSINGDIAITQK